MLRSILFPNSVRIFTSNVLNSLSGWLITSVSLFNFQGFSPALSIESSSFAFSFYLTFSVSTSLGETVTYFVLEAVSSVGASSCRPSALPFGGRSGFDEDASHIFPQGVLAAITLVGGVVVMG